MGAKWKIWILSFHWYPMVHCRSCGLATTASQSQAIFQNVQKCWKWAYLASDEIPMFRTLRFMMLLFFKRAYDWQWLVHSITLSPDSIVSNNGCLMQLSPASEVFFALWKQEIKLVVFTIPFLGMNGKKTPSSNVTAIQEENLLLGDSRE